MFSLEQNSGSEARELGLDQKHCLGVSTSLWSCETFRRTPALYLTGPVRLPGGSLGLGCGRAVEGRTNHLVAM